MRPVLPESKVNTAAQQAIHNYFPTVVQAAQKAVDSNEWVIIGMSLNPHVKQARKILDSKGAKYQYIEHGGYLSMWKERLAIKLWSGWPTFPQVFHKGQLIGGADDLKSYAPRA